MDGISLDTALLFKYFRGLTTGGERKRVEDWMQISEENEKTVLQAARIFYISQTSERILSRNSIEAYKKVQKRIDKRKKKIRLYEIYCSSVFCWAIGNIDSYFIFVAEVFCIGSAANNGLCE